MKINAACSQLFGIMITLCSYSLCNEQIKNKISHSDCLKVEDIRNTSAVVHWKSHISSRRQNHFILCSGTYFETLQNGTTVHAMDSIERYIPMEVHRVTLTNLKARAKYSCVVVTEGIGAGTPCHFITEEKSDKEKKKTSNINRLYFFRSAFQRMASSILLGGVAPASAILICIGLIILCKRYQIYRQRKKYYKRSRRTVIRRHPANVLHKAQHTKYKKLSSTASEDDSSTLEDEDSERDIENDFKLRGITFRAPPPFPS